MSIPIYGRKSLSWLHLLNLPQKKEEEDDDDEEHYKIEYPGSGSLTKDTLKNSYIRDPTLMLLLLYT